MAFGQDSIVKNNLTVVKMDSQMSKMIGISALASVAVVASGIFVYNRITSNAQIQIAETQVESDSRENSQAVAVSRQSKRIKRKSGLNRKPYETGKQAENLRSDDASTSTRLNETIEGRIEDQSLVLTYNRPSTPHSSADKPIELQNKGEEYVSLSNHSIEVRVVEGPSAEEATSPCLEPPDIDTDVNRLSKSLIPWQALHLQISVIVTPATCAKASEDMAFRTTVGTWSLLGKCTQTNADKLLNDWKRQGAHKTIYQVGTSDELVELHRRAVEKGVTEVGGSQILKK